MVTILSGMTTATDSEGKLFKHFLFLFVKHAQNIFKVRKKKTSARVFDT
jgi:hypothetical protein